MIEAHQEEDQQDLQDSLVCLDCQVEKEWLEEKVEVDFLVFLESLVRREQLEKRE